MADTKISALTAAVGTSTATDDDFVIVDTSAGATKRLPASEFLLWIQQNYAYLAATTAAFTSVLETKINGIEASADVTDAENVAASGAMFDLIDDTSPTLGGNLDAGAFGIYLGGTVDASHLLADYEEGSFTAALTGGGNADATYSYAPVGAYTKVGKTVTGVLYIETSALGTISGDLTITGLPFTVKSGGNYYSPVNVAAATGLAITAGVSVTGYIVPGTATIILHTWDAATGTTAMQASEWTADGAMTIGFSYITSE